MLSTKEWKETKLKARRTPTMWGHGIDNPKKFFMLPHWLHKHHQCFVVLKRKTLNFVKPHLILVLKVFDVMGPNEIPSFGVVNTNLHCQLHLLSKHEDSKLEAKFVYVQSNISFSNPQPVLLLLPSLLQIHNLCCFPLFI
jgi:hypothetical protein